MNTLYGLWFHSISLSDALKYKLWKKCLSCKKIYESEHTFYMALGLNLEKAQKIQEAKKYFETIKKQYEQIKAQGTEIITIEDKAYPERLKEIEDPPIVIFVKGDINLLNKPSVAIVGGRKCSDYGYGIAKELGNGLAHTGFSVVSGMALGIDEAAHKGALSAGNTLAVLGTGVEVCYPKQNRDLYESIQEKGCLLSEFFPQTKPMPYQFPKRNRIISGMTLGTVVIEAAERSGSLITAELALQQNREVFAVPGNVNSALSLGCNKLIQGGAKLVIELSDILEELMPQVLDYSSNFKNNCTNNPVLLLDKVEIMVYDNLSWQPMQLVHVAQKVNISEVQIEKILLKLEIKGFITRLPGRRYVRLN